jgi:hypothetical protein
MRAPLFLGVRYGVARLSGFQASKRGFGVPSTDTRLAVPLGRCLLTTSPRYNA